ncbi:8454_t:CDS:1, partial [Acaulospora morrowiae]
YKTIDSSFSSTYQPPSLYPTAYSKFLPSSCESSSPYFVPHDSSDLTITTKTLDDIINSVISNEE